MTIASDARMKTWPGATRVFQIQLMGSGQTPKTVEFKGDSVNVVL
jgi:hypothetical protein